MTKRAAAAFSLPFDDDGQVQPEAAPVEQPKRTRVRKPKPVPVLDASRSAEAREAGIAHAAQGSSDEFKLAAMRAVEAVARVKSELTSDDVWVALDGLTSEDNRALGAVMRQASGKNLRLIETTGRYVPTTQVSRHRAPIQVWRSLVYASA